MKYKDVTVSGTTRENKRIRYLIHQGGSAPVVVGNTKDTDLLIKSGSYNVIKRSRRNCFMVCAPPSLW